MESKVENKNALSEFVDKTKKLLGHKEKPEFTAEYAWIETTYGEGSYRSLEERISDKQKYIINTIKSKFPSHLDGQRSSNSNGSYRCVVDIEEDLYSVVDEIFKPFKEGGFKIINLSDKIDEIDNEHVYLISWKKIFNFYADSNETDNEHQNDSII